LTEAVDPNAEVHGDLPDRQATRQGVIMREDGLEKRARGVLAELESCLATHDLDRMVGFFTEDVALISDAEEAFGSDAIRAHLRGMADMEPTVHWEWDRVAVVLDAPGEQKAKHGGTSHE
jgi:ketosteroid isomerase-like protein